MKNQVNMTLTKENIKASINPKEMKIYELSNNSK